MILKSAVATTVGNKLSTITYKISLEYVKNMWVVSIIIIFSATKFYHFHINVS